MTFRRPEVLWALALLFPYAAGEAFCLLRGGAWARRLAPGEAAESSVRVWRLRRTARAIAGAWAWVFAAAALAGPSWGYLPSPGIPARVEAALVLDVSNSMLSEDVAPSRLSAARDTARALIRRRGEAAFSVTVFKGAAGILCPVTDDPDALDLALDWTLSAVLTAPGTSVAEGIRAALAGFSPDPGLSRFLVLFSDGDDLAGGAVKAAREARERGVRILAVGCGGSEEVPARNESGSPVLLPDGSPSRTALRAPNLRRIAAEAGGFYVDVSDPVALEALSDALDGRPGGRGSRPAPKPADRTALAAFLALLGLGARALASLPSSPAGRKRRIRRASAALVVLSLAGCHAPRLDVLRGNRLSSRGRYEEAIAAYRKAGAEEGDGTVALNLAGVYSRLGESAAAGPLYERALASRDRRVAAAAYHNLGVELFVDSKYDEAAESFKKALRLAPENPETKRALELARSAAASLRISRTAQRQGASVDPDGRSEALFSLLRRAESDRFRPPEPAAAAGEGLDH